MKSPATFFFIVYPVEVQLALVHKLDPTLLKLSLDDIILISKASAKLAAVALEALYLAPL